ncbi:MAG: toprim domain-containing protein [Candidatus Dormibacteria bacterium]
MRAALPLREDLVTTPAAVRLVLQALKVEYREGPKELNLHCVFHHDTGKPNLFVNIELRPGIHNCFVCGAHGGFDLLVRQLTGWPEVRVLQFIRQAVRETRLAPGLVAPRPRPAPPEETALTAYRFRHPYLSERGLTEETLLRWEIGYDKTANEITFPWRDRVGRLVAVKRRSVATKRYTYAQGTDLRAALYGLHLVQQGGIVWTVEGEIDAMFLDQCFRAAHLDNHFAVAYGGDRVRGPAILELQKKQPEAVVLLLDNDSAGKAAQTVIKSQMLGRVHIRDAAYPDDNIKDPNQLTFTQVVDMATSIERSLT